MTENLRSTQQRNKKKSNKGWIALLIAILTFIIISAFLLLTPQGNLGLRKVLNPIGYETPSDLYTKKGIIERLEIIDKNTQRPGFTNEVKQLVANTSTDVLLKSFNDSDELENSFQIYTDSDDDFIYAFSNEVQNNKLIKNVIKSYTKGSYSKTMESMNNLVEKEDFNALDERIKNTSINDDEKLQEEARELLTK